MHRQRRGYYCGVASIANALEVLGIRRSQREVARLCDCNEEAGTDEVEMKRGLLANGVAIDEFTGGIKRDSVQWLYQHLCDFGPAILCVDDDEHWVTVIGICKDRFLVFDPSRNEGVQVYDPGDLSCRWRNSEGIYYGLGISLLDMRS